MVQRHGGSGVQYYGIVCKKKIHSVLIKIPTVPSELLYLFLCRSVYFGRLVVLAQSLAGVGGIMLICIHKCIILRINPLNRIHVGKVHSCKTTDKLKLWDFFFFFYAPFSKCVLSQCCSEVWSGVGTEKTLG